MSYLTQDQILARRRAARRARVRRRRAGAAAGLGLLVVTMLVLLVPGGSASRRSAPHRLARAQQAPVAEAQQASGDPRALDGALRIVPPSPGTARVYMHGATRNDIALTFDDGFCAPCAARIIHTLARTGVEATIFPNGRYAASWDPLAPAIRQLIARGQLTIGNHTFLHHDALEESPAAFELDLANDEQWVEHTFGVSARPYFRPPYGAYDSNTLAIAGQLGYTKVITWSGTVADSSPRTIGYILGAVRHWARPGAIILMHANYPATSLALPQIFALLRQRGLHPVTLSGLLG